jgi:hypothetical protein
MNAVHIRGARRAVMYCIHIYIAVKVVVQLGLWLHCLDQDAA